MNNVCFSVWSKEITTIPKETWKILGNNTYEIKFILYNKKEIKLKLVGIPIGDWIVLNLTFLGESRLCKTRAMTANVVKHVNLHQKNLGKLWNLKELALE